MARFYSIIEYDIEDIENKEWWRRDIKNDKAARKTSIVLINNQSIFVF